MSIGFIALAVAALVGFGPTNGWKTVNYQDKLSLAFSEAGLHVGGAAKKGDTAWNVTSPRNPLSDGTRELRVEVKIRSTRGLGNQNAAADHGNKVIWYSEDGNQISVSPLSLPCPSSSKPIRVWDVVAVPADARAFAIRFGFDRPDLGPSDSLDLSDLTCEALASSGVEKAGIEIPDLHVPTIEVSGAGCFRIDDPSGIVPASVKISVDGTPRTHVRQEGYVWKVHGEDWTPGLHIAEIEVANAVGNRTKEKRAFYVGQTPRASVVTLREDGVTLVDGEPFFPIGAYNVKKDACNGRDLDRAFADLKEMGFNFAHTYEKIHSGPNAGFLDAAARNGFKLFISAREAAEDKTFETVTRFHPSVLAWYLADDTADNTSPEELRFLDSVSRALDPDRPTCQADGIPFAGLEHAGISRYSNYVTGADVCMPEIYPIRSDVKADTHKTCVATVKRVMRMVRHDIATRNDGKPRAVWPILQAFRGWERWPEFPTFRELYATTFAALAEGAQGMTWYTYCGWGKNEGFAVRPEFHADTKTVALRVKELIPVLTAPATSAQASVTVLEGPTKDPLGAPVLSCRLMFQGDAWHLLAVNASPERIRVRFVLPDAEAARSADVRWEGRAVPVADGAFEEDFEGFGVHVYKVALPPVAETEAAPVGRDPERVTVANPSFDVPADASGALAGWTVKDGIRATSLRGEGRNGTGALRIDETRDRVWEEWVSQDVALKAGKGYRLSLWIKTAGLVSTKKGCGAFAVLRFVNAKGEKLTESATPVVAGDADWTRVEAVVPSVPADAARSVIQLSSGTFAKGTAWFDDVEVVETEGCPVVGLWSSGWRDRAADGDVRFVALLALDPSETTAYEQVFSWSGADGRVVRTAGRPGRYAGTSEAVVSVTRLAKGRHPVSFELIRRDDGTVVARKSLSFERVDAFPAKGVRHDARGRLIVDGKPFFLLGMYSDEPSPKMLDEYLEAPFNAVLPYPEVGEEMLAECARRGVRVVYGQSSNWPWTRWSKDRGTVTSELSDRYAVRRVQSLKDNPAILGWYINDEVPFAKLPDLERRYRLLREADANHPVLSVNFHVDLISAFLGATDAIGTDPYPYPKDDLGMVADWTRKTVRGVFGMRPVIMAPQAFDWKDYSKWHGEGFPTREAMRNMGFQAIANGANGLVWYAYGAMKKNFRGKPDEFRAHWADVVAVVKEIKEREPWLLSDEIAPEVGGLKPGISARAFVRDGRRSLLLVNSGKEPAVGELTVGSERVSYDLSALGVEWINK